MKKVFEGLKDIVLSRAFLITFGVIAFAMLCACVVKMYFLSYGNFTKRYDDLRTQVEQLASDDESVEMGNIADEKMREVDFVSKGEVALEEMEKVVSTEELLEVEPTEVPVATVEPAEVPKATKESKAIGTSKTQSGNNGGALAVEATKVPTVTEAPKATPVPTQAPTPKPTNTPKPACINHSWDGGNVTVAATCANEGSKTYTCTNCGATKSESIGKTDHSWYEESWSAPTCVDRGYSNWLCSTCGAQDYNRSGNTEPLGHTSGNTETIGSASDCQHCEVTVSYCGRCGAEIGRSTGAMGDHSWATDSEEIFNEETLEWMTVSYEYCTTCGTTK